MPPATPNGPFAALVEDVFVFLPDASVAAASPAVREDWVPGYAAPLPGVAGGAAAPGGGAGSAPLVDTFQWIEPEAPGGPGAAKGGNPGKGGGGGGGGGKPDKPDKGGGKPTDPEDPPTDPPLDDYLSGAADGEAGFDILIDFIGGDWTLEFQQAFLNAADYVTTIITGDIGGGAFYQGVYVDDLLVTAELTYIDGSGGVLGQAGPTALWTETDLTAAGVMEFDTADAQTYLDAGLWQSIVTHELFHVLGFGTLWGYGRHTGLVDGTSYVGANAVAANGGEPIAVEQDGGPGTAGGHWDEAAYRNELMTGYIDNSTYLSEVSVMALADLGYQVVYADYPYDDSYTGGVFL